MENSYRIRYPGHAQNRIFFHRFNGLEFSLLFRSLLHQYKQYLALNPERIPQNSAVTQFAEALSKAWSEYNNPRAVVIVVVQTEERNMSDQQWLCKTLKERYPFESCKMPLIVHFFIYE
ncbi:glutathione synthetase, chloroplastic-like isoform X2 [Olea europaea var. sylvestris]|uniref:glutathione synthetase, chloroplastic-like isoform X2 n=1 Tax=Olea europaea var. sylvestris TaxID=158386 RepID=UPI000C1D4F49|nr:glutathione synthetase, chloroplastic-like isoform X2 [Olea europaea var. sylvestris]